MIKTLEEAALAGGKVLQEYFSKGVVASYKTSHNDIVTEADTASQKKIYEVIVESFKRLEIPKQKIGFLGEEKLSERGEYLFIIDPLDGTNNFASGFKYFCISIALAHKGSIIAGVIFDPNEKILYVAEKGKGAYKLDKGEKIILKVKPVPLKDSLISFLFSKDKKLSTNLSHALAELQPHVRGIRSTHATALDICHVAENVFQVSHHPSCSIWDLAAAKIILEESGGVVVDGLGKEIVYDFEDPDKKYFYIATSFHHPKEIVEYLTLQI